MHPFIDTSKMTDEEIVERLGRAYTYMNSQKVLGHSPTVLSIRDIIQSLEDERAKRMQKTIDDELMRKNPDSLKPIELGKLE